MNPDRLPPKYWTDTLRGLCRDNCAYPYGEPPCWQDVDDSEPVGPCRECYVEWLGRIAENA